MIGGGVGDPRKATLLSHHIVIGKKEDAQDLDVLRALGVTHVLNATKQLANYHPTVLIYHKVPLLDAPTEQIALCCDAAADFMAHVERVGGRVLVHCIAGSSRSVACVLMHLMRTHRIPLYDAFLRIRRLRPQADPNDGFKLQLALLEVKLLGGSSVAGERAKKHWSFYEWNIIKTKVPKLAIAPTTSQSSSLCAVS